VADNLFHAALMFKAVTNEGAQPGTHLTEEQVNFFSEWPYVTKMQKLLGASGYDLTLSDSTFKTGRKKYFVVFYKDTANGRVDIAKHEGMQLTNKSNVVYYVCRRQPIPEPPKEITATAELKLDSPQPYITCLNCSTSSTTQKCQLICAVCKHNDFKWTCVCSANPIPPQHAPTQELIQRQPAMCFWVKYKPPLAKGKVYHATDCAKVQGPLITMDMATDFHMKQAVCSCAPGSSVE
jgi:hypothetical protein